MSNQAAIIPIQKPKAKEKILLTAAEKIIVDLISTAIVTKTFKHEKRGKISAL